MTGTDEQLVRRAQNGNQLALHVITKRFDRLATARCLPFFLPGGDYHDLNQEARYGLVRAVQCYDASSGVPFSRFATLCIDRQLLTALKSAQRFKHRALTESARIGYTDSGEDIDIVDLLPSTLGRDPLQVLIDRERLADLLAGIRRLTPLERASLLGIASGVSYSKIAAALGVTEKSVDNASQRARRHLQDAA